MDYAYEDSGVWTDFNMDNGRPGGSERGQTESSFGWRSKNDTVLPYYGPENEKGQRSLQSATGEERKPASVHIQNNIDKMEYWLKGYITDKKLRDSLTIRLK